jgi:hypothetical protein
MNVVLDVAFVLTAVQFFKGQFGLENKAALACAFSVSLVVGLYAPVAAAFPAIAPFLEPVINVIALFIASAGSYNLIKSATTRFIK